MQLSKFRNYRTGPSDQVGGKLGRGSQAVGKLAGGLDMELKSRILSPPFVPSLFRPLRSVFVSSALFFVSL
jgi:hypothetical protein